MPHFDLVPFVDVQIDNFKETWPTILLALKTATFVGIDAELSGLGDRRRLNSSDIDVRYQALNEVSKSRSVLSLGLSFFRIVSDSDQPITSLANPILSESQNGSSTSPAGTSSTLSKKLTFRVQTFNILLLCNEDYVVEPASLKFLIAHGFDFNQQYAKGIPYYRGSDQQGEDAQSIRHLFAQLVLQEIPVVFHNALVDLVFLYQNFYTSLPPTMLPFLADLAEIYAGGVFDTKYMAEFQARMPASFLEYVFRRCQRQNENFWKHTAPFVSISFLQYPKGYEHVRYLSCGLLDNSDQEQISVCEPYAAHGWCKDGEKCPLSHDLDRILDHEHLPSAKKKKKRRNRRRKNVEETSEIDLEQEGENDAAKTADFCVDGLNKQNGDKGELNPQDKCDVDMADINSGSVDTAEPAAEHSDKSMEEDTTNEVEIPQSVPPSPVVKTEDKNKANISRTGGHRAGIDAFMTGYIFACFISQFGKYRMLPPNPKLVDLGMQDFANKVCLGGKDIPLQITKSSFSKTSKEHRQKWEKISKM